VRRLFSAVLGGWLLVGCAVEMPIPQAEEAIFNNPLQAGEKESAYLLRKSSYTVTYHAGLRRAISASWILRKQDIGSAERQNQFRPDLTLPEGWTIVRTSDYTGSGMDRGHLCPSADRTATEEINQETFLMTNIVPQSPQLNRGAWANLEEYARDLARAGYVVHQWVGVYGEGGEGSQGTKKTIGPGIQVPGRLFKMIWAIPEGENWASVRAVRLVADFPNADSRVSGYDWVRYLTSWEELSKRWNFGRLGEGLDSRFLNYWNGDWWDYRQSPVRVVTPCETYQGKVLFLGPEGGCFYRAEGGRKVYVEASRCQCETSL